MAEKNSAQTNQQTLRK